MAIFRNIQMSFWTDTKIVDDFTPEDKFLYLYLMTNQHTNLCGCYEISLKQVSDETGYTKERVEKLLKRLEEKHKVIVYSRITREILIVNWHKYNWTTSVKFRVPLEKEIRNVKNADFKGYLSNLLYGSDTVSIPYQYGSDTTVTDTDTDINNNSNNSNSNSDPKKIYGEYKHVRLTEKEYEKLVSDYGKREALDAIRFLDEYMEMKGYTAKNHNLALRKWVFAAVEEAERKGRFKKGESVEQGSGNSFTGNEERDKQIEEIIRRNEQGFDGTLFD